MMMAWYLHPRQLPPDVRTVLVAAAILAVPAVLIARQPDLGTALLVASSGLFALFLAGLQWRLISCFFKFASYPFNGIGAWLVPRLEY